MKLRRFLSGLLFGIGCALSFVGVLTLVLPEIPNPQLQLVLQSFSLSSDNAAVMLINRAMSFAIANSPRVLALGIIAAIAGACLLSHFTPRQALSSLPASASSKAIEKVSEPPSEPVFAAPVQNEPDNPFAKAVYSDHLPARPRNAAPSVLTHASPMLEKNRIEESPPDTAPYRSARFAEEARSVEAQAAAPSPSGSRALFRAAAEPAPVQLAEKAPVIPEEAVVSQPPDSPLPSTPVPSLSPRIRSTMGQHGKARSNLPTSRS